MGLSEHFLNDCFAELMVRLSYALSAVHTPIEVHTDEYLVMSLSLYMIYFC